MENHIRILAILLIVWGAMHLIGAFVLGLIGMGIPIVAFSAQSQQLGGSGEFAFTIVGIILCILAAFILLNALLGIVGGIGLMNRKPWSRIFCIVSSVVYVTNFPFGTALGIFGLWVLFNEETRQWLEE